MAYCEYFFLAMLAPSTVHFFGWDAVQERCPGTLCWDAVLGNRDTVLWQMCFGRCAGTLCWDRCAWGDMSRLTSDAVTMVHQLVMMAILVQVPTMLPKANNQQKGNNQTHTLVLSTIVGLVGLMLHITLF